jgi:hypothetical protein
VILGKLIPAGTGFRDKERHGLVARAEEGESIEAAESSLVEKVPFSAKDALEEERVPAEA